MDTLGAIKTQRVPQVSQGHLTFETCGSWVMTTPLPVEHSFAREGQFLMGGSFVCVCVCVTLKF